MKALLDASERRRCQGTSSKIVAEAGESDATPAATTLVASSVCQAQPETSQNAVASAAEVATSARASVVPDFLLSFAAAVT